MELEKAKCVLENKLGVKPELESTKDDCNWLEGLEDRIILRILSHLTDAFDLARTACVSRRLRRLSSHPSLWTTVNVDSFVSWQQLHVLVTPHVHVGTKLVVLNRINMRGKGGHLVKIGERNFTRSEVFGLIKLCGGSSEELAKYRLSWPTRLHCIKVLNVYIYTNCPL